MVSFLLSLPRSKPAISRVPKNEANKQHVAYPDVYVKSA